MDSPSIYAIVSGSILVVVLSYQLAKFVMNLWSVPILHHLLYPYIFNKLRGFRSLRVTRLHFSFHILIWVGNVLTLFIKSKKLQDVGLRAAKLSLVNLLPLVASHQQSILASCLGMHLDVFAQYHRSLGCLSLVEGAIHVAIICRQASVTLRHNLWGVIVSPSDVYVCAVADLVLFYALVSLVGSCIILPQVLKRIWYELFLKVHLCIAILAATSLWIHLSPIHLVSKVLLLLMSGLLSLSLLLWTGRLIRRNRSSDSSKHLGYFDAGSQHDLQLKEAGRLEIPVVRPWKVQPGQYIQVSIPTFRFLSFLQTHPFNICWWTYDEKGILKSIYVLMGKRSGLIRRLLEWQGPKLSSDNKAHTVDGSFKSIRTGSTTLANDGEASNGIRVLIDGPYGVAKDLSKYGTIVLFATGIGIASQLSYMKSILESPLWKTGVQRMSLYWEVSSAGKNYSNRRAKNFDSLSLQRKETGSLIGCQTFSSSTPTQW